MYLFSLNKKGTVVLHEDAMRLCPIFFTLDTKELLFLVLAVDYYSPYRQLNKEERYRRANVEVFKDVRDKPWMEEKIAKAIREYEAIQYDSRMEQMRTYQEKIDTINAAIRESNDPRQIKDYININKDLRKSKEELEKEIVMAEEQDAIQLYGKGSLSLLERLVRNKEKYEAIVTNKPVEIQDPAKLKEAIKEEDAPISTFDDEFIDLNADDEF